jgi:hypothetical protein
LSSSPARPVAAGSAEAWPATAPIITPRSTHRTVIVSLHQGKMPANRNFCDRGLSTESIRYLRGKTPAGAMAKR